MKLFKMYRGLPRSVYIIFIAQIINRFGDFVMPFLTLFLTKKLGFSMTATGTIVMIATLMTIPGSLLGGKVADHLGRKKSYLFFQGSAGISLLLCAFFYHSPTMLIFILLSAFFNGAVRPIISAILADVLSPEQRQVGFSLSYLGINIGVALGPMVAGFLFNHFLIMIFIGDAITTFIAVTLMMKFIDETMPEKDMDQSQLSESEKHEQGSLAQALMKRPQLIWFLIFNAFFSATYIQGGFSLPLILEHLYGEKGPQIYGALISTNAITVLAMTILITAFSKRFRPIVNIAIGGIAYSIGFGMIGLIEWLPLFWMSTIIWTLGEIIMSINFGVYIVNQSPSNFRARFNGLTSLSWAAGAVIGTSFVGLYADKHGIVKVWGLIALFSIIGTIGMFVLSRWKTGQNLVVETTSDSDVKE